MSEQLQQVMDEYGEYCLRMAYLYTKDWALAEEVTQLFSVLQAAKLPSAVVLENIFNENHYP